MQADVPGERVSRLHLPLSHKRRCMVAIVKARQVAIDLATVVDYYEGNINHRWRTVTNMLNDDRRRPIMWVNTAVGVVYDCVRPRTTTTMATARSWKSIIASSGMHP